MILNYRLHPPEELVEIVSFPLLNKNNNIRVLKHLSKQIQERQNLIIPSSKILMIGSPDW